MSTYNGTVVILIIGFWIGSGKTALLACADQRPPFKGSCSARAPRLAVADIPLEAGLKLAPRAAPHPGRHHGRNRPATIPPVHVAEVGVSGHQDAVGVNLRKPDKTGIGQIHRDVLIAS